MVPLAMLKQLLAAILLFTIVLRSEAQPPPVQTKADLEKERAADPEGDR